MDRAIATILHKKKKSINYFRLLFTVSKDKMTLTNLLYGDTVSQTSLEDIKAIVNRIAETYLLLFLAKLTMLLIANLPSRIWRLGTFVPAVIEEQLFPRQ